MPDLEDASDTLPNDGIFNGAYDDDEDVGAVDDFNNMDNTIAVIPIPTLRIHKDYPKGQILRDPTSAVQTRGKIQKASSAQQALFKLQKVWVLVDLPYGKKEEGIDYDEVFAPVARIEAIRLFLAFASYMGFTVYQMDVKSAFLYGTIEEEVYVHQPLGFVDPAHPNKVYKVIKALYGLHQAPRAWYETLSSFLMENGFRRGTIDKTLFIKKNKSDIMLVQVYVDDIIFGSTKKSMCTEFEECMHKRFQMSSMGELTFFLGLQVKQQPDGIFISQDKYVADILKKFDFLSIRTATTPIESNKPLVKDEDGVDVDVHVYRSMIGSLMYLTASRPDIMFAVCACARFQVTPKASHLNAVKRIFRYLKHQPKLGLWYPRDSPFELEAFSDSDYRGASLDRKSTIDSDYGGASLDRKSTTGGCQFFGRRLISWQCKKQTIVANSTTEVEYVATANCCGQVLWIQNQIMDYGFNFMNTKIHIDNESTISVIKNPVAHSRTKHIEIRFHFIRDCYEKRLIEVIKIHTDSNVADLLTKGFDVTRFNFLVVSIGLLNL
ncbi:putative ribonuclease H-like domain-containing protein [Tanacetum coccineum]